MFALASFVGGVTKAAFKDDVLLVGSGGRFNMPSLPCLLCLISLCLIGLADGALCTVKR